MSRKKEYMINDTNYYKFMVDIGSDVVEYFLNALREIYVATFLPKPEPNFLAYNLLSISMFYDTSINRLFVTYRLDDDRTQGIRMSDCEIYNRVYDKLYMITKDQDIKLSIVGEPARLPEFSNGRAYGITSLNSERLRIATRSLWTNIPGPHDTIYSRFLEDKSMLQDDIRKNNMDSSDVARYCQEVVGINKRYLDTDYPKYNDAFDAYAYTYKNYFGRTLKKVEEWRAFTIYIDVTHDVDAEKINDPDHDMGRVLEFERVKEYIREWAIAHNKEV
jgi:hypothetical protein